MDRGLYRRLAWGNLVRNRQMYLPYGIATAIMSGMCFIVMNLVFAKSISNMSFGTTTQTVLAFGTVVMDLFTFGYMFYINSFLIKRRRKEFGLYGVLGLEKRHVGRIIRWENLILDSVSLALGLVGGTVFGQLTLLALLKVLHLAPDSRFVVHPVALIDTVVLFLLIFIATTAYNVFQVRLANPIDLLNGEKKGEKKPRGVIPMAILGLLLLGTAYAVALGVKNPGLAISLFWPAVLLVIIASWLLFTSGSAFVLRILKNNKKFYYQSRNFIAIGGLIHRMKQNAAGLSNICILSTMVLVTVSGCCGLFFGQEDILRSFYPDDVEWTIGSAQIEAHPEFPDELPTLLDEAAAATNTKLESFYGYRCRVVYTNALTLPGRVGEDIGQTDQSLSPGEANASYYMSLHVLPLDDYNRAMGESRELGTDELLLLTADSRYAQKSLTAGGHAYAIRETICNTVFNRGANGARADEMFLVAATPEAGLRLAAELSGAEGVTNYAYRFCANVAGEEEDCLAFTDRMAEDVRQKTDYQLREYQIADIFHSRRESNALYGGLIFLGAFFAIIFLTNTVLLIYFKQISEGYDDRARFEILQKVGMDDLEVKKTINKQISIVFFLPLAAALVHTLVAGNMLQKIMEAFSMYNLSITFACIGVTCALFAAVYLFVYRATAKVYYRLVKW